MSDRLTEIRQRWAKAQAGPWAWRGYTDGSIELRTLHSGQRRIISTQRQDPCIGYVEHIGVFLHDDPCGTCKTWYQDGLHDDRPRCEKPENLDTVWVWHEAGCIKPINDFAVPEVHYRSDVARVDQPDADAIAHAPEDVAFLIAEVERLRDIAAGLLEAPPTPGPGQERLTIEAIDAIEAEFEDLQAARDEMRS